MQGLSSLSRYYWHTNLHFKANTSKAIFKQIFVKKNCSEDIVGRVRYFNKEYKSFNLFNAEIM